LKLRFTWKRTILALGALTVAFVALEAIAWLRPMPRLEVGRDTTWLTGPLDANGNVDYDAAWRAEHSPGVTAANNAAPLVYAVLGFDLSTFAAEERAAVPKVEQPIGDFGDWARSYGDQFATPTDPKDDGESEARRFLEGGEIHGPQERAIAAWFDSIGPALAIVEVAAGRERFYAADGAPRSEQSKNYWAVMDAAKALALRARRRANSEDLDAACTDLCTLLRLARLIRSMGGHIHCMVGTGCESCLWEILRSIATEHAPLPADVVRRLHESRDTTPLDPTIETWLASERVSELQVFDYLREHDFEGFRFFSRLDPNRFNRRMTAWADRVAAAWADSRGWSARLEAFDALHRGVKELRRSHADVSPIWCLLRGPAATADWAADHFGTMSVNHAIHVEEFIGDVADEDRLLAESAAAGFAKQFGRDPDSSDELTPSVFPTPFRDRLFGSGLSFKRDEKHALIASGPLVDLLARIEELRNRRE
jgi:hypothetical protein